MANFFVPAHPTNYGGYGRDNEPRALVFHTPEEKPDDIESTPDWFWNPAARASTQYYISDNGDRYQMVPDAGCAWACGTRAGVNRVWKGVKDARPPWSVSGVSNNCLTLNVEIEGYAATLDMPEAQYQAVLEWTREKCAQYDIPIDRDHLVGHGELASDRSDPGPNFPWDRLMADLKGEAVNIRPMDQAETIARFNSIAASLGAAISDRGVTMVELLPPYPPDIAPYVPQGGHAFIATTTD